MRDFLLWDVLWWNLVFLLCLLRWKWFGDKVCFNKGDLGFGEVWGVIVVRCGDVGDFWRVKGDVLWGWCLWVWEWEGEIEVGEGVFVRGDMGMCVDDFFFGEWIVCSFGIIFCRVFNRREKIRLGCLYVCEWLKNFLGFSLVYGVVKKFFEIFVLLYFVLWWRVV